MSIIVPHRYNVGAKVRNNFKLQVRKASDDSLVRESGLCGNIITKNGLNAMLQGAGAVFNCAAVCGAGNTPATINDNLLESFIGGTNQFDTGSSGAITPTFQTASSPIWYRQRRTWRFGLGVAEGNVAEVGVAIGLGVPTSTTPLFSRALVVDSNGDPTVIPVGADEYLDLVYDFYSYPQENETGQVTLDILGTPTVHDYILRASRMTGSNWITGGSSISGGTFSPFLPHASPGSSASRAYAGAIGPVTGSPATPIAGNIGEFAMEDYTQDSFQRDFSLTAGLTIGNHANGLRCIDVAMRLGAFQIEYDPPIPKTAEHVMRFDFRASLANV